MSLGIYGDGGSMRGSGIDSTDYTADFFCSDCEKEFELDGMTDDYGIIAYAECPDCAKVLEVEVPSREDLREDYYADYDPDK
jgi:transcription elongation factor Elf1